jgi:hypothetical protein
MKQFRDLSGMTYEAIPGFVWDDKYSNDWSLLIIPGALAMAGSVRFLLLLKEIKRSAGGRPLLYSWKERLFYWRWP